MPTHTSPPPFSTLGTPKKGGWELTVTWGPSDFFVKKGGTEHDIMFLYIFGSIPKKVKKKIGKQGGGLNVISGPSAELSKKRGDLRWYPMYIVPSQSALMVLFWSE